MEPEQNPFAPPGHPAGRTTIMSVQFVLTARDFWAFNRFLMVKRWKFIFPAGFILISILPVMFRGEKSILTVVLELIPFYIFFTIFILLTFAGLKAYVYYIYFPRIRKSRKNISTITVTPEELQEVTPVHQSNFSWPAIVSCFQSSMHLFIQTDLVNYLIIPAHAFQSESAFRDFCNLTMRMVEQAGQTRTQTGHSPTKGTLGPGDSAPE